MDNLPYQIQWCEDKTNIVVVYFYEGLTWNLYTRAIDELLLMIDDVEERVDIVIVSNFGMPEGNPFPHLQRALLRLTGKQQVEMIIRAGNMTADMRKEAGDIIANALRLDQKRMITVSDVQEAINLIEQDRVRQ